LLCERFEALGVAVLIAPELLLPKIPIRARGESWFATMAVPKAAVNKYDLVARRKYQVRAPREILPVKAKAIAESMNKAPHRQFRLRVLAPDCAHILAAIHANLFLEFLFEPIQNSALLLLPCAPDLR